MTYSDNNEIVAEGRRVLELEAASIKKMAAGIDQNFALAVQKILQSHGRLVTSGMGKAGHIAMKAAATLASTGTPSFFLHPAEAVHGDLGMVAAGDVALLFSHSGETEELCRLLPYLEARQVYIMAITANSESSLARGSDLALIMGDIQEACPLHLAPTSSTTCMLALGDALAAAVLQGRGFTPDDFARLHPAGALGRSLCQAQEAMRQNERCPRVSKAMAVRQVVEAISRARSGCACIVDEEGHLLGVFTDGDFRRAWAADEKLAERQVGEVMTAPCKFSTATTLVREAKQLMAKYHINALPVVDGQKRVVGLLDIQDL